MPDVTAKTLRPILTSHIDRGSYLMTDESKTYAAPGEEFSGHGSVNHSAKEYVRGQFWHTNTIENAFSLLKRGITGNYHHVSQKHLRRHLGEFDFRFNSRDVSDLERADWPPRASPASASPIGGLISGKRAARRLTIRQALLRLLARRFDCNN